MAILRINKRRGLKFVFSGMLFALCMLRGLSLVARIVWASYPKTVGAVIAAGVMTQCGSVLIFVINLFFAQRVLRAYHPRLGWHRGTCYVVWFLIACVLCCLVMAIVTTVHTFFTLNPHARRADRAVQLFAGCYLAFLAFLPVPVVVLAATTHPQRFHVEKFGEGRWRAKVGLLVFTSLVATLGAGFRVGVGFDARPAAHPAWFHSRACYYGFNFVTDLIVSTAYLLARFDRRFIVPDGARGPGDYSPILPSTQSKINLEDDGGKLPLMGTMRPLTMLRRPYFSLSPSPSHSHSPTPSQSPSPSPSPSPTPVSPTSPRLEATKPSTSSTPSQHFDASGFLTDSSNTAVQNTPSTSRSFNRSKYTPPQCQQEQDQNQPRPRPKSFKTLGRRRGMMLRSVRMRINSEADAYGPDDSFRCRDTTTDADPLMPRSSSAEDGDGDDDNHPGNEIPTTATTANVTTTATNTNTHRGSVRAPAPAHLGPPILPALNLDLELLSATLLAPWALDSWGFETNGWRISRTSRNSRAAGNIGLGGVSGGGGGGSDGMGVGSRRGSRKSKNGGGVVSRSGTATDDSNGSGGNAGNNSGNGSNDGSGSGSGSGSTSRGNSQRSERARTM